MVGGNVKYEASETEMIVIEKFLGNYLEVRLSNCFLIEVSQPILKLIDYFESNSVRVHERYDKIVMLLYDYLSKFVKNSGVENNNRATGKDLLKVDFKDPEKHLPD